MIRKRESELIPGVYFLAFFYNSSKYMGCTRHESLDLHRTREIHPLGKVQIRHPQSLGYHCLGDFGLHLHQRSAYQVRLCAPDGAGDHGGP